VVSEANRIDHDSADVVHCVHRHPTICLLSDSTPLAEAGKRKLLIQKIEINEIKDTHILTVTED